MKVYVLPADAYGCGHSRLIWPASQLQREGHDVVILPPHEKSGFGAKFIKDKDHQPLLTALQVPPDADVIVLQRPAHILQPQMINMMRQNGIAVVVDMDDDMNTIDPHNNAYWQYSPRSKTLLSWKHAAASCRAATMVTTSTRALQRTYAGHGRGVVLDNFIPAACLKYPSIESGRFGWAGTTASHPKDLQASGRAVQALLDDGLQFQVVGGKSKVKEALRLREEPEHTGFVGIQDWVKTIAATLDVGMVPLASSAFNTAKSRLKGIEYMAAGVAWVASPREEYRKLNRESGCGFLAETEKDWVRHIKALMTDDTLRKEQVEQGREYMETQTYQAHAWRWMEAWTEALRLQRG